MQFSTVMKMFHFYNKLWWVRKSEYCTIMWNRRGHGANEMDHDQPHQRPVFIQRRWCCMWWDWKGVLYYELLLENQMIHCNKYCSQLDQLKTARSETCLKLVNRKCIVFYQDSTEQCFFDDRGKKSVTSWRRRSDLSLVFTRCCTFRFLSVSVFKKFS